MNKLKQHLQHMEIRDLWSLIGSIATQMNRIIKEEPNNELEDFWMDLFSVVEQEIDNRMEKEECGE